MLGILISFYYLNRLDPAWRCVTMLGVHHFIRFGCLFILVLQAGVEVAGISISLRWPSSPASRNMTLVCKQEVFWAEAHARAKQPIWYIFGYAVDVSWCAYTQINTKQTLNHSYILTSGCIVLHLLKLIHIVTCCLWGTLHLWPQCLPFMLLLSFCLELHFVSFTTSCIRTWSSHIWPNWLHLSISTIMKLQQLGYI